MNWPFPGLLALLLVGCDDGDSTLDGSEPAGDSAPSDAADGGRSLDAGGCRSPSDCVGDEVCRFGRCAPCDECGCQPGDCGPGQTCSLISRSCVCVDDTGCPQAYSCLDGACVPDVGVCVADGDCAEFNEDGRSQACDTAAGACVSLFVCCGGPDRVDCGLGQQAACDGDLVLGVLDCASDPCSLPLGPCDDSICPDDRYCMDDRCLLGCRLGDPDACPSDTEICDPERRACLQLRCDRADDCPDDHVCDPEGFCQVGGRADAACAPEAPRDAGV